MFLLFYIAFRVQTIWVFRVLYLTTELRLIGYVHCFFVNKIGNVATIGKFLLNPSTHDNKLRAICKKVNSKLHISSYSRRSKRNTTPTKEFPPIVATTILKQRPRASPHQFSFDCWRRPIVTHITGARTGVRQFSDIKFKYGWDIYIALASC